MSLRIGPIALIAGIFAGTILIAMAGEAAADPASDAMAGTYQVTFDSGTTQSWNIRSGCTAMLATCVTVNTPSGAQIAEITDGRWSFHVSSDPGAATQTTYSWDPSTLTGSVLNVVKGPCNYRACDYRNEPAGSFTMTRTG